MIDLGSDVALHALAEGTAHGAEHLGTHLGAHGAARAIGVLAPFVVSGSMGTFTAFQLAVDKPAARGEAIGRGFSSDQARFAGAMITEVAARGLLPAGYVPFQRALVVGTGSLSQSAGFRLATKIQTDIDKGEPQAVAFRDALVSSVRMGIDAAHLHHIDSRETLEGLLSGNSEFRGRYETDAGFQLGVRAAMWQARVHPEDFANAERERGLQTTAMQLAQGA
jgi:pimeloyl-ACP methyl ester carboxylesterase